MDINSLLNKQTKYKAFQSLTDNIIGNSIKESNGSIDINGYGLKNQFQPTGFRPPVDKINNTNYSIHPPNDGNFNQNGYILNQSPVSLTYLTNNNLKLYSPTPTKTNIDKGLVNLPIISNLFSPSLLISTTGSYLIPICTTNIQNTVPKNTGSKEKHKIKKKKRKGKKKKVSGGTSIIQDIFPTTSKKKNHKGDNIIIDLEKK